MAPPELAPGNPELETAATGDIDDDAAAEIIRRAKPALERAAQLK
jgi:hypothetical protein